METSRFWRDLQDQFRALLDSGSGLYAMSQWEGDWRVDGGPSDETERSALQAQFCALAERGALAADLTEGGTPLDAWLNELQRGPHYVPVPPTEAKDPGYVLEGGYIDNLCRASAERCVQFESESYAAHVRQQPRVNSAPSSDGYVGGPVLAGWLRDQLKNRCMTVNRLRKVSDLDRKTIERILRGMRVRATSLPRLVKGLSHDGDSITLADVPR